MKIIFTIAFFFILISCDNTSDIFQKRNEAPIVLLKTSTSDGYAASLSDSFRISNISYLANIKVVDEQYSHLLIFDYEFIQGTGDISINITDSVLSFVPDNIGINEFVISISDPYGMVSSVNVRLFVYDNLPPIPHLTFKKLANNNYEVNASKSYDTDGVIVNYHFDYGVNSIDFNEPIVEIWKDHLEQNGGLSLILTDDKGAECEAVFFELI